MQDCASSQGGEEEALVSLFYNVSALSFLLLLLLYSSVVLLAKFFHFVGAYPLLHRNQDEYDYTLFSEEEEEEDHHVHETAYYRDATYYHVVNTESDDHHLVANIHHGGDSIVFCNNDGRNKIKENFLNDQDSSISSTEVQFSAQDSSLSELDHDERDHDVDDVNDDEEITISRYAGGPTEAGLHKRVLQNNDISFDEDTDNNQEIENVITGDSDFSSKDEKFISFKPSRFESRKFLVREKEREEDEEEEIFGDSCTNGSTSKSSSEWRSSIKTEDPFSSSSRRSCPKWESYTVFQKYDEEMMFLGRISAQKLHETESLKSFHMHPRSVSERIVQKFNSINKKPSSKTRHNPYHELESAYIAQICLTWEALNWNYKNFERKKATCHDFDLGCPAGIAQQFQQFQVLLQRYIENEPYEHGRRPEIYARMRMLAPKLLLVPEYQDLEDDKKDEGFSSKISSAAFLMIMEECIRTFMNFLKADKEKPCQIIKSFFGRSRRGSVDPTLLQLMKKVNAKKKTKLKDLRRGGKCMRKKKLKIEEEMEILMGLIDLKVVSRVLRMREIGEEQLHWCEEKMSKVRIMEGKLQRDSSPLFFPTH